MKKLLLILTASLIIFAGCTKSASEGPGKLVVKVTDDPFNIDYVESAMVTITKIEIKKAGDGESDGNQFLVISEDTVTFDLLTLRNGITEEIANIDIPQGDYDQVRLYVDQASLKIKGQPNAYTVKVPSGKQTGIKIFIKPSLSVSGGLTSELLLDFDLSKSFVMRGNMAHSAGVNGFIFKPVIKAANNSTAGRIEGHVADTANKIMIENAKVWVMVDTLVATAFTDATGYYAFIGMPAGDYTVFANKEDIVNVVDYDTVSYPVVVVPANRTVQDFILTKQ